MRNFNTNIEAESIGNQEAQMTLKIYIDAIIDESNIVNPGRSKEILDKIVSIIEKEEDHTDYLNSNELSESDNNISELFSSIHKLREQSEEIENDQLKKNYLKGIKEGSSIILREKINELDVIVEQIENLRKSSKDEQEKLLNEYTEHLKESEREKKKEEYRLMIAIADKNISTTEKEELISTYKKKKEEEEKENIAKLRQDQLNLRKNRAINVIDHWLTAEEILTTEESYLFGYQELNTYAIHRTYLSNIRQLFVAARNYHLGDERKGLEELAEIKYDRIGDILTCNLLITKINNKAISLSDISKMDMEEFEFLVFNNSQNHIPSSLIDNINQEAADTRLSLRRLINRTSIPNIFAQQTYPTTIGLHTDLLTQSTTINRSNLNTSLHNMIGPLESISGRSTNNMTNQEVLNNTSERVYNMTNPNFVDRTTQDRTTRSNDSDRSI